MKLPTDLNEILGILFPVMINECSKWGCVVCLGCRIDDMLKEGFFGDRDPGPHHQQGSRHDLEFKNKILE